MSYLYSYVVNGIKFDGYFNNIPGLGQTLVEAKNSLGNGYAALANPDGTPADIDGMPWLEGIQETIIDQANAQINALARTPDCGAGVNLIWVTNSAATQAGIKAALRSLGEAAEKIQVLTIDQWNSISGR